MPIHDRGNVIKLIRKGSAMVSTQRSAPLCQHSVLMLTVDVVLNYANTG